MLVTPVSVWVLFKAQTWTGVGLAVCGLVAVSLPVTSFFGFGFINHPRFWRGISLVLATGLVIIIGLILLNTPSGTPPVDSPASHRFTKATAFPRNAVTNIVPEVEQINLGFLVMTFADPYITIEQAKRVSVPTFNLYREMEQDRNFHPAFLQGFSDL